MEPQVLLFDEPTAALDPEITAQIVSIIRELAETGITQVIVTHEVEVARKTASRVVYMENGHIVEQGMPPASRIRKLTRLKTIFHIDVFRGNDDEKSTDCRPARRHEPLRFRRADHSFRHRGLLPSV
ncbi:hypothetical protein LNN85_20505 [Klebsiella pneumoniae subsp. pneumoniae]|nr:hypothetical protein [Klebsiella pneumoniae subsp. pneumoniae]